MSNWIEDFKEEVRDLVKYTNEIEDKLNAAIESIKDISQGVGIKPDWYRDDKHDWKTAIKYKASLDLCKIAKMPNRKKPYIWRI